MIAYFVSRMASGVATAFGADEKTASAWATVTAGALTVVDPIGGSVGIAHAAAKVAAANGSALGRGIDRTMMVTGLAVGLADVSSLVDGANALADVPPPGADGSVPSSQA